MIWVTISSQSCFCWLYKASLSLAVKNTINLISVLTIWECPRVIFSHVVGRACLQWPVRSLGKTVSLCPASFCTPKPNLPITLGISRLPTFAFQSPIMKKWCWSSGSVVLERLWGDTSCPRAEKPQQDGRRWEIAFRIKPHTHQRCSEGSYIPYAHQDPETPQRLGQNCVSVSPEEVRVSTGLMQGQGLWVQ